MGIIRNRGHKVSVKQNAVGGRWRWVCKCGGNATGYATKELAKSAAKTNGHK